MFCTYCGSAEHGSDQHQPCYYCGGSAPHAFTFLANSLIPWDL
jgi:hypothetical protein